MKPTIDLHGITSLRFTPTQTYTREDGSAFASRDLVATDKHGQEFRIGLFADFPGILALRIEESEPAAVKDKAKL